ncbi:unnamed protein product [Polarella glacialis]|uniref:Calmodulin n=1 Tax=Polarella glacialis TaxID=89957 RepID=A0A813F1H2_POLGL|nr:unnamed protein product [Polarella glacialis]
MELIQAINEFDSDGMGVIGFSDFLVLMTRRINNSFICTSAGRNAETNKLGLSPDQIERYQRAFSSFDSCGDASIPTNLLGDLIRSLGLSFSREELLQMINEVDADGMGTFSIVELLVLMARLDRSRCSPTDVADSSVDGDGSRRRCCFCFRKRGPRLLARG